MDFYIKHYSQLIDYVVTGFEFDSADEAQAEIDDTLDSMADACQRGDMSCAMHRDEFRITTLQAKSA